MLIISGKDDLVAVLTGIGPTERHLVIVDAVKVIVDREPEEMKRECQPTN